MSFWELRHGFWGHHAERVLSAQRPQRGPGGELLAAGSKALLNFLLPPQCPTCDERVPAQGSFCAPCFAKLTFITEPLCRQCGLPFGSVALAGSAATCATCTDASPPWREARAALLYDDGARGLSLPFKHADRQEMADLLATHMARAGRGLLAEADLLVPVPLHRWRLFRRGFNQAALLAYALGRRAGVRVLPDALWRQAATRLLGGLSAAERRAELGRAIAIRPHLAEIVTGRRVVLVDDVMTSGATAGACTRALLDAGAAHVDVLVAARVADPRRGDAANGTGRD